MKKASIVALTAAAVMATTASPLTAWARTGNYVAGSFGKNSYVVIGGAVGNCDSIKEFLAQVKPGNGTETKPEAGTPGNGAETKPEAGTPGNGAETKPEAGTPGNGTETKPETGTPGNSNETTFPENTPGQDAAELSFAEQVVKLVNEERAKVGLAELTVDKNIEAAALVRAKETEQSFSHTRPNGTSFSTALKEQGVTYRGAGENIAWGQKTPEDVMRAWMNSEGHRANILNAKFTKIGVGYYRNAQGRNYWTQLFTY